MGHRSLAGSVDRRGARKGAQAIDQGVSRGGRKIPRIKSKDVQIENVYFPEDCVLSLVISMPDERTVEVATVGQEGVLGLSVLWGTDLLPVLSIGEVPGKALKLSTKVFREAVEKFPELNRKMSRSKTSISRRIAFFRW